MTDDRWPRGEVVLAGPRLECLFLFVGIFGGLEFDFFFYSYWKITWKYVIFTQMSHLLKNIAQLVYHIWWSSNFARVRVRVRVLGNRLYEAEDEDQHHQEQCSLEKDDKISEKNSTPVFTRSVAGKLISLFTLTYSCHKCLIKITFGIALLCIFYSYLTDFEKNKRNQEIWQHCYKIKTIISHLFIFSTMWISLVNFKENDFWNHIYLHT